MESGPGDLNGFSDLIRVSISMRSMCGDWQGKCENRLKVLIDLLTTVSFSCVMSVRLFHTTTNDICSCSIRNCKIETE